MGRGAGFVHRVVTGFARALALMGGAVLIGLVLSTTASIMGRSLNTVGHLSALSNLGGLAQLLKFFGPINGDYELVEAGVAIAVFAFLPLCQLNRAHAMVDVFTGFLGSRFNAGLALIWEVLLTAILFLVTWRISVATLEKFRYGETTFLLQMPLWWSYAICTVIAGIAAFVGFYVVWGRVKDLLSNNGPHD